MKRVVLVAVAGVVLVIAASFLSLYSHAIIIHLSQESGTSNSSSRAYDFWSGFGSDIGEIALIGGMITVVRRYNCHQKGCWRLGIHLTARGHKLCKKHISTPNSELNVHPVHEDHQ